MLFDAVSVENVASMLESMPELAPLTITARNRDQAEYLVRSRAQQRGVSVRRIDVAEAGPGAWLVTVTVDESDVARLAAAALDEDTQVLHFRTHPSRPTASDP